MTALVDIPVQDKVRAMEIFQQALVAIDSLKSIEGSANLQVILAEAALEIDLRKPPFTAMPTVRAMVRDARLSLKIARGALDRDGRRSRG